ncbi:MAG: ABC-ATPase domain-containing protein, partial [Acetatifactor sp.]|nr:ABC-ATPase domain-containing protein [Acetatifactor sp.]
STLLDALEQGIYFHVAGDGREYVIVEETACKIYAEDGRVVHNMDISPFFSYIPGQNDRHDFSTLHASGSLSQATNIVEAVYGGSRLLLIDEDTSATNFMIRDRLMRQLVQKESIIPYTDRIRELRGRDVSTILVIGGSGEYLEYGDCVLLLEDYRVQDRTEEVEKLLRREEIQNWPGDPCKWMDHRSLPQKLCGEELPFGRSVRIDNGRFICLGEITADITRLTALGDEGQINTLAWLLEQLLWRSWPEGEDLNTCCRQLIQNLFEDSVDVVLASRSHGYELWLEEVRSLDLVMAAGRLRRL